MNDTMEYRGYTGSVSFSAEDNLFFGKVMGIRSLISYQGETLCRLQGDFQRAVEAYLAMCAAEGVEPERPKMM